MRLDHATAARAIVPGGRMYYTSGGPDRVGWGRRRTIRRPGRRTMRGGEAMKASELKGRAVISLAEAQKVGEVENVLFDLGANQVSGFRVKQGLFSGQWLHAA